MLPPSLRVHPALSTHSLSLRRSQSIISAGTLLPRIGVLNLSLLQLTELIEEHRSLQCADILSCEGYIQRIGAVKHRFVVLELVRRERKPVWLRLDRRRSTKVSALQFLRSAASTPSNDTVSTLVRYGQSSILGLTV